MDGKKHIKGKGKAKRGEVEGKKLHQRNWMDAKKGKKMEGKKRQKRGKENCEITNNSHCMKALPSLRSRIMAPGIIFSLKDMMQGH
jgi:hypothetical protein